MKTFSIPRPAGFRLQAAIDFYAGFTPGSGMAATAADRLTLAFRVERTFEAVVVSLHETGSALIVEYAGNAAEAELQKQLGRMLGLEADAQAWSALAERAPLVGQLQRAFPGFFTATKASPYDAAVWSIISPRISMAQAARIKQAIAREYGSPIELRGHTHDVFPAPATLLQLEQVAGLSEEKVARLRGVAQAALDRVLDAEHLRALDEHDALAQLQSIRGIGPWSASHIYYRGAAPIDGLPTAEPRMLHGLAAASGQAVPSVAAFRHAAESWRPFRMWVCVLLARHLARTDGWQASGLLKERAAAGKALARSTKHRAPERTAERPS